MRVSFVLVCCLLGSPQALSAQRLPERQALRAAPAGAQLQHTDRRVRESPLAPEGLAITPSLSLPSPTNSRPPRAAASWGCRAASVLLGGVAGAAFGGIVGWSVAAFTGDIGFDDRSAKHGARYRTIIIVGASAGAIVGAVVPAPC